jgi:hypothetical protein
MLLKANDDVKGAEMDKAFSTNGARRSAITHFSNKPRDNRPFGRTRSICYVKMDLEETGSEYVNLNRLVQKLSKGRVLVKATESSRFPQNQGPS